MKESDKLKVNLTYAGNVLFVSLAVPAPPTIIVYTYNLIRPGFTFGGWDWFAYIMSFAAIGFVIWFGGWGAKKRQEIIARDAEATPKPDVTEIRRKK